MNWRVANWALSVLGGVAGPGFLFFTQSMCNKLALPQAGWLSIFFIGKSVVLHLCEGPESRSQY